MEITTSVVSVVGLALACFALGLSVGRALGK
jgi:hypothetical protein